MIWHILIRIILYSFFFVLPFLGMNNCQGFNEGSMTVSMCTIDGEIFRSYANFYYALVLFSAFFLLAPLVLYVYMSIAIVEGTIFITRRWILKRSKK